MCLSAIVREMYVVILVKLIKISLMHVVLLKLLKVCNNDRFVDFFSDAGAVFIPNGYILFGSATGQIWLDSTACNGDEGSLLDCNHDAWGVHDCSHFEDVGVSCPAGKSKHTVSEFHFDL